MTINLTKKEAEKLLTTYLQSKIDPELGIDVNIIFDNVATGTGQGPSPGAISWDVKGPSPGPISWDVKGPSPGPISWDLLCAGGGSSSGKGCGND